MFLKALEINENIFDQQSNEHAISCRDLGDLYLQTKQYDKCETSYLQCLNIQECIFQPDELELSIIYLNIGKFYRLTNRLADSEKFLLKSLKIRENASQPDYNLIMEVQIELEELYYYQNNIDENENILKKCLENIRFLTKENIAHIYYRLGCLYFNKKIDYDTSEKYILQSLDTSKEISQF